MPLQGTPPLPPRALSQSAAPAPVPPSGVGLLPTSATPTCSHKHPQPQLLPSLREHSRWSRWWTFGASLVVLRCAGADVCFGVLRVVLILIAASGALIIKQSFGKSLGFQLVYVCQISFITGHGGQDVVQRLDDVRSKERTRCVRTKPGTMERTDRETHGRTCRFC
jgi:hypothetical protein